jgi:hypothetical protein
MAERPWYEADIRFLQKVAWKTELTGRLERWAKQDEPRCVNCGKSAAQLEPSKDESNSASSR